MLWKNYLKKKELAHTAIIKETLWGPSKHLCNYNYDIHYSCF